MRFIVQRVKHASVTIDNNVHGKIENGLVVLCGIADTDTKETADRMIKKLCGLRIFEDKEGKTNLSVLDVGGGILLISQFTLYADCKKGNRPSFNTAGKPDMASPLYDYMIAETRKYVPDVQTGIFGAYMQIELLNDGPFTVVMDSKELFGI